MDLKEFIKTTLSSIHSGLKEINKELGGKEKGKPAPFSIAREGKESFIEFDVALTVAQQKSKKGKASLLLSVVSLGGEKGQESSEQTVSRIKFTVKADQSIE